MAVLGVPGVALAAVPAPGHRSEPVIEHPRTASGQLQLSNDAVLRALADRWGGGWIPRFDEATGRLQSVWVPGLPLSRANDLVADLAGDAELELVNHHRRGEVDLLAWVQVIDGLPVWGSEIAVFARNRRIQAVRLNLYGPPAAPSAGADRWFPWEKSLVPVVWEEDTDHVTVRRTDGTVLTDWSKRMHATVTTTYEERTDGDPTVVGPVRGVTVADADTTLQTDTGGVHGLPGVYDLAFEGDDIYLYDVSSGGLVTVPDLEGDVELQAGTDLSWAAADVFSHYWVVRDWLEATDPAHALLDVQVYTTVNRTEGYCNAWYTSGTINFLRAGGGCVNLGRIADVVYHEYGHGVHHYAVQTGGFAGDISEGSADYISATITGDPQVGVGWRGGGSGYIREIDTDHRYPDDVANEVHYDGLIWASFLWNLRADWVATYGDEAGAARTDALLIAALEQGPSLTTAGDAVIIADDDDGDLTNGTPHACDLITLLDQHGLGPGPIGVVVFGHEELDDQSSQATSYPVAFTLADATPDCSGLDRDSVRLWYTPDPVDDADLADGFEIVDDGTWDGTYTSASGALWHSLDVTAAGPAYTGDFPRQLATSHVTYFMEARSLDGTARVTTHTGQRAQLYDFWVGDREAVWCEGFETGAEGWEHGPGTPWESGSWYVDQWEIGPAEGAGWDPADAFEGSNIAGTALAGTGYYSPNNLQYLRSPEILVEGEGRMRLLSYRRWLTVEDGLYDHARMYIDGTEIYANDRTAGGSDHTLDRRWTQHEFALDDLATVGVPFRLTWTLSSDPGLEYGGWNIDDVCVVQLADVPGHYRVRDFDASDAEYDGVHLSWSNPWIAPLETVAVVRKRAGYPEGIDDGVLVFLDEAPTPGEAFAIVDTEVLEGETYHYAVFTSEAEGTWYTRVEPGENADRGGRPHEQDYVATYPDPEPEDTGSEPDPEPKACGCATGGVGAIPWLAVVALLVRRRRSRQL